MIKPPCFFLFAVAGLLLGAGCANITTTPGGDPNRVITGTVNYRSDLALPPDAEVVVRLLDPSGRNQASNPATKDLPVTPQAKAPPTPVLLAEQTIKAPGPGPIPFRLEYSAEDDLLRRGLNLEARISFGGRVRLRTVSSRVVTLGNSTDPHSVWVEAVAR